MTVEVPAWLNKKFVQEILIKYEKDDTIGITKIDVKTATNKGDNYSSIIYRICVVLLRKGQTDMTSLIAKVIPTQCDAMKEMLEDQRIFDVEASMMKNTLSKMNQLLGEDDRISARFIFANLEQPIFLIEEDLTLLGFRLADRQAGLDLPHSLLAIRNLAKFHGSSVAVCEKEPEQRGLYKTGMFGRDHQMSEHFFNSNVKILAEAMVNWPEFDSRYAEKILRFSKNTYRKVSEIAALVEDDFNVINHGDCWVNNMMFRYDDAGRPVQQIFVDFQISSWGSPALDLHYFLSTSLSPEVDVNHRDRLLEEYRKTLSSTMTRLGCKRSPPTESELQATMDRLEICAMVATFTILPIILVKKDKVTDIKEIIENKNRSSFENESLRKVLFRRIPEYEKKGLLDL